MQTDPIAQRNTTGDYNTLPKMTYAACIPVLSILHSAPFQVKSFFVIGIVLSEEIKLANTTAAKKDIRKNARRRQRNRLVKVKTRTVVKHAVSAVDAGDADAATLVRQAQIELDSAASKGIIHKNAAARKKSRLAKRMQKASVTKA